jgi:hypothetical protein
VAIDIENSFEKIREPKIQCDCREATGGRVVGERGWEVEMVPTQVLAGMDDTVWGGKGFTSQANGMSKVGQRISVEFHGGNDANLILFHVGAVVVESHGHGEEIQLTHTHRNREMKRDRSLPQGVGGGAVLDSAGFIFSIDKEVNNFASSTPGEIRKWPGGGVWLNLAEGKKGAKDDTKRRRWRRRRGTWVEYHK